MHKRYMNVMFFLLQMLQMRKQHTPPYVFADQAAAIEHQDENMLLTCVMNLKHTVWKSFLCISSYCTSKMT